MTEPSDSTRSSGPTSSNAAGETGVLGGDAAERMDSPGPGSGGLAGGGADGETGAREQLRKDLGERNPSLGTDEGGSIQEP